MDLRQASFALDIPILLPVFGFLAGRLDRRFGYGGLWYFLVLSRFLIPAENVRHGDRWSL